MLKSASRALVNVYPTGPHQTAQFTPAHAQAPALKAVKAQALLSALSVSTTLIVTCTDTVSVTKTTAAQLVRTTLVDAIHAVIAALAQPDTTACLL